MLIATAMLVSTLPVESAEIVGVPNNATTAAVHITSCSVTIDPENANAFPAVDLAEVPNTPVKPVSAQVEFDLHDALGGSDETHVLVAQVAKSPIPLASYPVDGNYVGLACHLRSITFADGSVVAVGYQALPGGSNGSGVILGVLGGLALVGGIAAAAGHNGGSNNPAPGKTPAPSPTPIAITASATPSPTPTATPSPTASPTSSPTPTPTPIPTPSPTASPGSLVVSPQSLTFIATGGAYAKTTQATETHYSGAFMASPASCSDANGTGTTVASISPASTTTGLFTVTPLGPGTCTFEITDANGDQVPLGVGVTTTGGTVQTHRADPSPGTSPTHPPKR